MKSSIIHAFVNVGMASLWRKPFMKDNAGIVDQQQGTLAQRRSMKKFRCWFFTIFSGNKYPTERTRGLVFKTIKDVTTLQPSFISANLLWFEILRGNVLAKYFYVLQNSRLGNLSWLKIHENADKSGVAPNWQKLFSFALENKKLFPFHQKPDYVKSLHSLGSSPNLMGKVSQIISLNSNKI